MYHPNLHAKTSTIDVTVSDAFLCVASLMPINGSDNVKFGIQI
jgi:hypothetical protein